MPWKPTPARQGPGDETLKTRPENSWDGPRNVSIDGQSRKRRAKLRIMVKRISANTAPPDKQEKATQTVLEQAECL